MISVIIPVYNVENYLVECLDSVEKQTYKDIEIIIVNDGSTDNSLMICEKYAEKDKRVKILSQKNAGLSAARNAGIRIAQGEFITFIDSDDIVEPDMIQYLIGLMKSSDGIDSNKENKSVMADMAVCQRQNVDKNGQHLRMKGKSRTRIVQGNKSCMREFFTAKDMDTVAWGKLYKTVHFHDIKYPAGKYHEDVFTTYLIVSQCEKIVVGEEKKYLYRQRMESISKAAFSEKHLDAVIGNLERIDFIKKHYPELTKYAEAGAVYAANQCALKIIKARGVDDKCIGYLQTIYRKYESSFLKGKSGVEAKLFSVLAFINLKLFIRAMLTFEKLLHKY